MGKEAHQTVRLILVMPKRLYVAQAVASTDFNALCLGWFFISGIPYAWYYGLPSGLK